LILSNSKTELDSYLCVSDVDECYTEDHTCAPNALCLDTDGGYMCRCHEGTSGNGHVCHSESPSPALTIILRMLL